MKTLYYLISLFFLSFICYSNADGQITITTEHMPQEGDTVRVSISTTVNVPDPSLTGFNFNWDYSMLESASQNLIQFINPNQTPPLYQIIFNLFVTNLAVPIQQLDYINFEVTDAYAFYKNSSTEFTSVGYAATFMGVPVPMKYNQAERIYKLPLSQNSVPDSTTSAFTVQYPQLAYFSLERKRVNTVDGAGTLTTPYGTFDVLRVKSVITEHDSLYLDSLQMGTPIIRNITEYRWVSPQFPVPVLTISKEGLLYNIQFIDSIRNLTPLNVTLGEDQTICQGQSATITAQASGGFPPYTYNWSTGETTQSIIVTPDETTLYTVTVSDSKGNFTIDAIQVSVTSFEQISLGNDTTLCAEHNLTFNLDDGYDNVTWFINDQVKGTGSAFTIDSTGIGLGQVTLKVVYQIGNCSASDEVIVTFQVCNSLWENTFQMLTVIPNPATNFITIENLVEFVNPEIEIINITGKTVDYTIDEISPKRLILNINNLGQGIFLISVKQNEHIFRGKFIKL